MSAIFRTDNEDLNRMIFRLRRELSELDYKILEDLAAVGPITFETLVERNLNPGPVSYRTTVKFRIHMMVSQGLIEERDMRVGFGETVRKLFVSLKGRLFLPDSEEEQK